MTLEEPSRGATLIAAPRVVLAAGRAFKNHTRYDVDTFENSGHVLIFSGTDTHGPVGTLVVKKRPVYINFQGGLVLKEFEPLPTLLAFRAPPCAGG